MAEIVHARWQSWDGDSIEELVPRETSAGFRAESANCSWGQDENKLELVVEKSIEIAAPAVRVWEVLTTPDLTREWVREWWPDFIILESDWQVGSPMSWRASDGGIDGKITAVRPGEVLEYSFTMPQDIVRLTLDEQGGHTRLSVSHGDFADKPDGEECYQGALAGWSLSLPKIKELAENSP